MPFLLPELGTYLDSLVPQRDPEMVAMETLAAERNFPIIGPAAGQFLYHVALMIGAERVFELGSGYGYSTAWLAKAVRDNGGGVVHHVVWDESLSSEAKEHLGKMRLDDLVTFTLGEAVEALRNADGPFDLIFNDIDKSGYPASLEVIESKLRPGGVLLVDNMLWSGRVMSSESPDAETKGILEMTRMLFASPRWRSSLVPIRDGVSLSIFLG